MKKITRILVFCTIMAGCSGPKQANRLEVTNFDKQGHRGARGLMPENTIPAMLKAVDLGMTTLETDVVITKDRKVILSHEPFFNHDISTRPDGTPVTQQDEKKLNIYQMDYAQVKGFDVGMRPHPRFPKQEKIAVAKPLLAEMIDAVEQYCAAQRKPLPRYNIETKSQPATDELYHPAPDAFVDLLVAVLKEKKIEERATIQSFDIRTLQSVHRRYPGLQTALLVENTDKKAFALQLRDLGFLPTIYSPHFTLVTPLLVKQCRDAGISLVPWTVNEPEKIKELRKMGVNGIISDFPDLLAQL